MKHDNMPPLPETTYLLGLPSQDRMLFEDAYTDDHMRSYARTYAEQVARPLVEALQDLIEAAESMQGTFGRIFGKTPEHDDLYTHDQWAESFLKERADQARAALAAHKEQS